MIVAAKGSVELLNLCLNNKSIDIQVKNELGVNSFWIACLFGHGEIMQILAENGIDIFCKNHNNENAMHIAVNNNHVDIVEMLL